MKMQLRYDQHTMKVREHLTVGNQYWAYITELNSKSTGLIRNVKPFRLTLTNLDNSYYVNEGMPDYWSFSSFEWDFSECKKKMRQPDAELYYSGFVFDTEKECVEDYNRWLQQSAKQMKSRMSRKYNAEYIKGKVESVLKNIIKTN